MFGPAFDLTLNKATQIIIVKMGGTKIIVTIDANDFASKRIPKTKIA